MFQKLKLCFSYIFFEMILTFFVGIIAFSFILLMFHILKFTDIVLQHSISLFTFSHLLFSISVSFLPVIFPMSLILAVVLTYNRLSADSEIIAMKSLGFGMGSIITPGIFLGLITTVFSFYTSFKLGPWGFRQFEIIMTELTSSKITTGIKKGTFSGFLDMVIYSNDFDKKTKEYKNVFIYDEREFSNPTTIIAEKGKFSMNKTEDSYNAFMLLTNGHIHKGSGLEHTKIRFQNYSLKVVEPVYKKLMDKSINSLAYADLVKLQRETKDPLKKRKIKYEWHKRLSLSFVCLLLVFLGAGFGCSHNNRSGKMGGGVFSVIVIVVYWVLFLLGSVMSKSVFIPIWFCAWLPVLFLIPFSVFFMRTSWN